MWRTRVRTFFTRDPMCGCHIKFWGHSSCTGAYWIPIANNKLSQRKCFLFKFIVLLVSLCLNFHTGYCQGLQLSNHIRHFEPAFYDSSLLLGHHRLKRDIRQSIPLEFTAHNREFKIRLKRDNSIFADDILIESTNGPLQFNFNKVYAGSLEDDYLAEVSGIINDEGIFDGHISTPNELYYIEPSKRYLPNAYFHSVIYKASDVIHPNTANCASQQLHLRGKVYNPWVDPKTYNGLFEAVSLAPEKHQEPSSTKTRAVLHGVPSSEQSSALNPTQQKLQAVNSIEKGAELLTNSIYFNNNLTKTNSGKLYSKRRKRSLIDSKKTTCMLYLQADHLFFEEEGTEEACIDKITRHVQRVNNIYKTTDFDRDGRPDNIGFMIKRIKIHNNNATRDPSYRFPGNYGVEKYLELFSEEDYDAFCLAYMFTYRDFEGGTLGLAWTGDLKNAGGVCEKNGHYRGSLKSLNTGIVTLLNYGKKVPPAVSHVTLAHEIGHNFGSPHDPEKDLRCTPGGEDGNYIMFARATSGDKQNNNKFSPCSLKQINNVLNAKARDTKGCFTEPQRAICGNGVVEEGEECDCGWKEDCEESCCFPMVSNQKPREKPCTLRPHKTCSPSQGPCCNHNCELKKFDLCREDNGCRDPAYCGGNSPYCPLSINKPNKTICKDEFVCFKGECTGSICLAYGLESCQCSRRLTDPETKSCELCCKLPGSNQPCISSFEWNTPPFNIPNMYAKPGTPCDNYRGYCDVFQKCREVDPSGPLATLRDILLSNESLANLQRWLIKHWYAVLLLLFTLLMLLAIFTKLCGRETKKKVSKRGKKGRRSKRVIVHKNGNDQFLTVVNGNDSSNHVVHPTAVRANLPFKRRVNEVKRAATKAKRVAKSQLGRPYKKSSKRNSDQVTTPTDSDKSIGAVANGKVKPSKPSPASKPSKLKKDPSKKDVTKKKVISSRLSVISFKSFRPRIIIKERKPKSKPSGRHKSNGVPRSSSKDLKKLEQIKKSMRKNETKKDDKKKVVSGSPEKSASKQSVPDKSKNRRKSVDKSKKSYEGNWLINKFLADEENQPKPILNGSLAGSVNSALNESPLLHHRSDSKRGLLNPNHMSPIRGIVNAAFISSPRGARTHSSLRVGKPLAQNDFLVGALPKYRRSISMESHGYHPSPEKRKRSMGEGQFEKKKKLSNNSKSKSNSTEDRSLSLSSSLHDSPTGSPSSHESIQMESPDLNAVQNATSGSKNEAEKESLIVSSRDDTPTIILLENSDFVSPKTEKEFKGKDWV